MARFFRVARAGVFQGAETWLCSLGVALLVLSVLLVPTSRLLADDGGGSVALAPNDCKANDGCNNGCAIVLPSNVCNYRTGNGGCTNGCSTCGCSYCQDRFTMLYCNCQCRNGLGYCANTTTCTANPGR